jgi:hypothetical protein
MASFIHQPLYPPRGKRPCYMLEGWVGPRAGLDAMVKRTNLVERFEVFTVMKIQGLLGRDAVWCCGRIPTFRRSMLPPSSGCDIV